MKEAVIQVRVPEELKTELKNYCDRTGTNMSEVVRFALSMLFLEKTDSIEDFKNQIIEEVIREVKKQHDIKIIENE